MRKDMGEIYVLLDRLGVTANYVGYFYTAYAVRLCINQPQRLLLVTKEIYPEVAKLYHTTWTAAERGIRTCINIAWKSHPAKLVEMAGYPLEEKPRPAKFLAIMCVCLMSHTGERL